MNVSQKLPTIPPSRPSPLVRAGKITIFVCYVLLHCPKYYSVRAACPKDQLEFQFLFSPEYVISQVIHGNQTTEI